MSTLSEVARTGRPFKRKGWTDYAYLEGNCLIYQYKTFDINAEMIVANDWEAKPLKLELDANDIMVAARTLDELVSKRRLSAAEFAQHLCKALGLTEDNS